MANDNQPLLHFGEDPEDTNLNSQKEQPTTQIRFGVEDETVKPQAPSQPVQPKTPTQANQPEKPKVETQSVQQKVVSPTVQQPKVTPTPVQPNKVTAQSSPRQYSQPTPKKSTSAADTFGKKNQSVKLIVVNGAGVVLPQYKIDQKVINNGQEIYFNDSREVYDVVISADGYKERRVQITQTDLLKGEKRISLATQLQSLVVSFNTPDGIKRGSIDIDQTNAIYEYIKEASHTDTPLNELQIGPGGTNNNHKPAPGKSMLVPYLIAMAIGLILGIGISSLFSCGGDSKDNKTEVVNDEAQTEELEVKDDEVKPDENAQTLDPQPEEVKDEEKVEEEKASDAEENKEEKEEVKSTMAEADVKYLKEKDIWKRSDAKSDDAKKLLAAFCSGNIEAITASHAYNNVDEKQRNGYYNKVLKDLQKIKTQSNADDAKVALRDVCKNGDINLNKILNRIHPMLKK